LSKFDLGTNVWKEQRMRFPNVLLRRLMVKATENAFDNGLGWGIGAGVFVTHLYYQDKMRSLRKW
jgi:hypothetical protein